MLLAHDRDQLIERGLVEHRLAYLMIPLRQKILGIPSKLGNHFGNREVPVREVADFCRTLVHEALTEVSNLPLTVSDPHWLKKAEDWRESSENFWQRSSSALKRFFAYMSVAKAHSRAFIPTKAMTTAFGIPASLSKETAV